jgi:hypothetical protein
LLQPPGWRGKTHLLIRQLLQCGIPKAAHSLHSF